MSEAEETFLQDVRQYARRLFIVVNKIDLLTPKECGQILDYIQAGISRIIGEKDVRLFPLSARLALETKLRENNSNDLSMGGLDVLEAALEKFLSEEKSKLFLVSILDRLIKILSDEELYINTDKPAPQTYLPFLINLHSRADLIRNDILGVTEVSPMQIETSKNDVQMIEHTVFSGVRRVLTPLKTRTCPICAAQSQTIFEFFAQYQNQLTEDHNVREAFVVSKGFCQVHTWQFEQIASPQGISEGYVTYVEAVASELRRMVGMPLTQCIKAIDKFIPDGESCLACRLLRSDESIQCERFLSYISTIEGQEFYRRTLGLCLPHLRLILANTPTKEIREFLLLEQARHLENLSEDMHSYTLKRDALRSGLLNSNEENAWKRALIQLVGERTAHIWSR